MLDVWSPGDVRESLHSGLAKHGLQGLQHLLILRSVGGARSSLLISVPENL